MVDVVDRSDKVVGSATLSECLERAILHRAVAVLVQRSDGSYLLQRRSKADLWMPGMLTLSCTGHVKQGETYQRAARRELREELGLSARLRLDGRMLMPKIVQGRLTEWEWVSFYQAKTDSEPVIDPTELEEVVEVPSGSLGRVSRSKDVTLDARLLIEKYVSGG